MKTLVTTIIVLSSFLVFSQEATTENSGLKLKGERGGLFSVGVRSTLSSFNGASEKPAIGAGGQFRLQFANRLNSEWFMDYLPATNEYTRRNDLHIGWSIMFYVLKNPAPLVQPYIIAGHCFDMTDHYEIANRDNGVKRWSSAVQAGLGVHFNLTPRLDISLSSQYMIHLGTDVHSHIEDGEVHFETHKGGSLEGHLLTTLSFNYKIVDLWDSKRK